MANAFLRDGRSGRAFAMGLLLLGALSIGGNPAVRADPDKKDEKKADAKKEAKPAELIQRTHHLATKDASAAEMVALIDSKLAAQWAENNITPSKVCTDYEFIRRVSLDLIGR